MTQREMVQMAETRQCCKDVYSARKPSLRDRKCPECGQTGRGWVCHHWDAAGRRTVPTVPVR